MKTMRELTVDERQTLRLLHRLDIGVIDELWVEPPWRLVEHGLVRIAGPGPAWLDSGHRRCELTDEGKRILQRRKKAKR